MSKIPELLEYIDPASCTYQEWCNVGMALKYEGFSALDWESWSSRDSKRYHPGECQRKWEGFNGAESPVTGGTLYQMATDRGYEPNRTFDWGDTIRYDEKPIIDQNWLEVQNVKKAPSGKGWNPAKQLADYLDALFEPGEIVGYVTDSYQDKESGKWIPKSRGAYTRTAGELAEALSKCNDITEVIGTEYNKEAGAWIRFNPLDGNGVRNANVTEYRFALIESDSIDIEKQYTLIKELELPVAVAVHSGDKSLHAIVRIDAADDKEYRKRVDYIYDVCRKNGLEIDTQNRNPSRLSRMPGVMRGSKKQYIVAKQIGKRNYEEWRDWIEGINDDMPEIEGMDAAWEDMPPLAPCLIHGILREGHKMLLTGPSKAGKSFLQIELCIAIAEGLKWLNFKCKQGKVLYVNLELDRASCLNRFRDVYKAAGISPKSLKNISIWNLRGRSAPMDKLAGRLIRRAKKGGYLAIIIDPIYKVITGDENSADQMAHFCNQFDKICTELGCSVIYCHHHSKGLQGQKNAIDRASGSGVFARDPDALLDMIGLPIKPELLKQEINLATCGIVKQYLEETAYSWVSWKEDIGQDDWLSSKTLLNICENRMAAPDYHALIKAVASGTDRIRKRTAWRIEATLREFEKPDPVNIWFDYPMHYVDDSGVLGDIQPESDGRPSAVELAKERKKKANERRAERLNSFEIEFENRVDEDGLVLLSEMADAMEVSRKTIGLWFGTGKHSNEKLKKSYEAVQYEGGAKYIKRRQKRGVTD